MARSWFMLGSHRRQLPPEPGRPNDTDVSGPVRVPGVHAAARGPCGPGLDALLAGGLVTSGQRPEARVPWPQPARGWLRAARSSMPVSGYGGRSGCGPTPPSRVPAARPCPQSPACPATPGTHSRRTGRSPKYIQYEGLRPAHREHAPDAAGPALRADDGTLRTRPSRWLWANLRPAAERSAPEGRRRCGRGSPLARAPLGRARRAAAPHRPRFTAGGHPPGPADRCSRPTRRRRRGGYFPPALDALAAAFISCLWARTLTSDSGPVMSATERNESGSP